MLVKAATVYPSEYPTLEETMNAFYQHPKHNIAFHYRCFDRFLLNAAIQPFQQPERVMGFFWSYRQLCYVTLPARTTTGPVRLAQVGSSDPESAGRGTPGSVPGPLFPPRPARPDRGHSQSPRARSHPAPYR